MRSNEQFKNLVYQRVEEVKKENKKKRAAALRGITAFSLVIVISGAFLYGNFNGKNDTSESAFGYSAECVNENGLVYGIDIADSDLNFSLRTTNEMQNEAAVCMDAGTEIFVKSFSFKEYGITDTCDEEYKTIVVNMDEYENAIGSAKNECTVEYNSIDVYYDKKADIWKVVFYREQNAGGSQCVYVNSEGVAELIEYGE
ncbi:MAG: hypothetical protein IJ002_04355 [Clostridia bacterium]|nr:hypothetical protein [Clostridia bacterium]